MKYDRKHYETINELLDDTLKKYPNNVFFMERNTTTKQIVNINASQVRQDVNKLGEWFIENNIRNKRIAILCENSYYYMLYLLAITNSGNIAVLLDVNLEDKEFNDLLVANECEYLCYSMMFNKKVNNLNVNNTTVFEMRELLSIAYKTESKIKLKDIVVKKDDPALIIFTSGTSGEKRGVVLSHQNIAYDSVAVVEYTENKGSFVQLLPLYHIFALVLIFGAVISGVTTLINQSIRYLQKDIIDCNPDVIDAVPSLLPYIYETISNMDDKKPRRIFCGGAASSKDWYETFAKVNVNLYVGYGMTETCACICMDSELFNLKNNYMAILDGQSVYIENPNESGIGEIMVKGPNIMLGYYKMPEETKKMFTNSYLHTGDLGMLKDDKFLIVVGRKKNIIVLPNGENISPEPIENKIMLINGVKECLIHENNGTLQALIYADEIDYERILSEIKELNHSFSRNMLTLDVAFISEPLEKNATGKIIRKNY